MGEVVFKLPDVGEGVAEAELVEWHVKVGDIIREDAPLAAVMTDKATVEIPSPAEGEIVWLAAEVGDLVAVGSDLVRLKVPGAGELGAGQELAAKRLPKSAKAKAAANAKSAAANSGVPSPLRGEGQGEGGLAPDANLRETPSPQPSPQGEREKELRPSLQGEREKELRPSPSKSASASFPLEFPHPQADGGKESARRDSVRSAPNRDATAAFLRESSKPLASPAVRLRARETGVDLRQVQGSGPAGRITHEDLDSFIARGPDTAKAPAHRVQTAVEEIKLTGLRRKIAAKMSAARDHIPHITYVEEVDVTALEELRATLNRQRPQDQAKLTLLPFLMRAMVRAVAEQPRLNAHFDDEAGVLRQSAGVHIGIAVQAPAGLMVPVVKHAEALDLWASAAEVARLSGAARAGTAARDELSGSTITISSLGAMGGIVSTPIINYPEVAIVGVNKIAVRPVWDGSTFIPRKMMNLSSSFDHRVIDGWEAAVFVQRIKALLETPALIFMDG
jgi:2-oxoisovalerate dehydrogenase E2 component (dihydrolipoyl transacylase)